MKLYFPEAKNQIDFVGYNHAVLQFGQVLRDFITDDIEQADARVYCNLPWHHSAKELRTHCNLPIVIYTMYESTILPSAWVKFLNNDVDYILVPSIECQRKFLANRIKTPISVLSLGYDPEKFKRIPKTKYQGLYVFLWQGVSIDLGGRKGADVILKAFKELREEKLLRDDVRLIMKVKPSRDSPVNLDLKHPNGIIYIQKSMDRQELLDIYSGVDCCINPTHGEGFGLIPLEQMAMGKPVLLTGWEVPYNHPFYIPLAYTLRLSPVTWNHKFLDISYERICYNIGKFAHQINFLPKLMTFKADDGRVMELLPPGVKRKSLSFFQILKNKFHNQLVLLQKKYGLYRKNKGNIYCLFQEHPGYDAWVNIEDLKNKMLWCYRNRLEAEDMGFQAHEYVSRYWTLDRMRNDFEKLLPDLELKLKELKNGRRK